ncbi:uncharacterized protein LOC129456518 [Periophthalmus magnuspinnatus]|uniref:uncharacterized protein LOC129456518 n=1 Tax=Periophthalmus magnuspinnatus TaxID=409849 RepID=UPI0024363373|nr:uncharacterized protein LOC129456518 [Periophthalmus magnuspinnatus]
MGVKMVTLLWMVIGVLFLLTVVTSKPMSLNTAADESDSVEVSSSEESAVKEAEEAEEAEESDLSEAAATEPTATVAPNIVEPTNPPATIALPAAIDITSFPSDTMDPQTSTDGVQMLPEEPSQSSLGVDVSQGVPATDPPLSDPNVKGQVPDQLSPNMDTAVEVATDLPSQAKHVQQEGQQEGQQEVLPSVATPHPQTVKKASRMAVVKPVPVYVNPGVPVCFTFQYAQYAVPHYDQPRGDSY